MVGRCRVLCFFELELSVEDLTGLQTISSGDGYFVWCGLNTVLACLVVASLVAQRLPFSDSLLDLRQTLLQLRRSFRARSSETIVYVCDERNDIRHGWSSRVVRFFGRYCQAKTDTIVHTSFKVTVTVAWSPSLLF